ncbi:MAG: alpha/beta fold hydrolase [Burkholderiales bacterium]|nr:alpha/beta fold hydrolase [Burkholderiales bacterium]
MPIVKSPYKAPFWAIGPHIQTVIPAELAKPPKVDYRREIWDTPDGDVVAVDWAPSEHLPENAPVLLHLHGLEGSSHSKYALATMDACVKRGVRGLVFNYRSCGGLDNKKVRSYTAADDAEWDWVLQKLKTQYPNSKIYAFGVSLGANNLLHWLGTRKEKARELVNAVVAVSAPMDLVDGFKRLHQGFSRLYELNFIFPLRKKAFEKLRRFPGCFDDSELHSIWSMEKYDDVITARINNFKNGHEYYQYCSSKPLLKYIRVPTLVIHALNDPIVGGDWVPTADEVSEDVVLEYSKDGGHCGFPIGRFPGSLGYLPSRTLDFCLQH